MSGAEKDATLNPWEVVPRFFSSATSCNNALNYYFVDQQLIPLFVHENYLLVSGGGRHTSSLSLQQISKACDSVSDADLIDSQIRSKQYYPLLPTHALLSTLRPGLLMKSANVGRSCSGAYGMQFPKWLGNNSKLRKNERLCTELATHMHMNIGGGASAVALDYLPTLKDHMFAPMESKKEAGIGQVIDFMKEYGLSREDWNSVSELGVGYISPKNRPIMVPTKVKSAFTRQCSHELAAHASAGTSASVGSSSGGKGSGAKGKNTGGRAGLGDTKIAVDEEGEPIDKEEYRSDNEMDENGNEMDALKNDSLIKMKKGRGAGAAASKRKGGKTGTKRKSKTTTKGKTASKRTAKPKTKSKRKKK